MGTDGEVRVVREPQVENGKASQLFRFQVTSQVMDQIYDSIISMGAVGECVMSIAAVPSELLAEGIPLRPRHCLEERVRLEACLSDPAVPFVG